MNKNKEIKVWFESFNGEKKWGYISNKTWDLYISFKDNVLNEDRIVPVYSFDGNVESVFLSEIKLLPEFAKQNKKKCDIGFKVLDLKLFSN